MPGPVNTIRGLLQERQQPRAQSNADILEKFLINDGEGVGGGRRTLKRNKTFAANTNGRNYQQSNGSNIGQRRHRRGTKGRLTVPLFSAPTSPMIQNKYNDPLAPLYIQTSRGIFEEAFGDGKRNSLNRNQINQLQAALALPDRCNQSKQISPTTTNSSGFGSTDALITSANVSPKSSSKTSTENEKIESSKVKKVHHFHFWIYAFIQYVIYYFRRISIEAKRRLESTPRANIVDKSSNVAVVKKIFPSKSGLRLGRLAGVKRKLKFDDEIDSIESENRKLFSQRKPYYSELHFGRESARLTNLRALEGENLQYPSKKFIERATETKFITTVFEIRQRGLEEIACSVSEEIQRWYGEQQDDNLIIVCCEMQWSTPDRFRNIFCEMRMKTDVQNCLRINNRRVLQAVSRRNEKAVKFDQYLILPESITEESVGRNLNTIDCFGGSYRRYYNGLLPWGHRETASEHQPWWELKKNRMPESIQWPLIASPDKTSVILLNLVCLKLDRL